MSEEQLTLVFKWGSLRSEDTLSRIEQALLSRGLPIEASNDNGTSAPISVIQSHVRRSGLNQYEVAVQDLKFDQSLVGSFNLEFESVTSPPPPKISWDDWLATFSSIPGFVMAWVADVEYEFWQSAEDPLHYTARGKPYEHLPMKSNGLPYPVEQMIVDTSANPGRRVLRQGYIEVVGHVMWLGEPFLGLTGAIKDDVVRADWLRITTPAPGVLRIQAADHPFATDEGESGELQDKLRRLLFPKSAKRK